MTLFENCKMKRVHFRKYLFWNTKEKIVFVFTWCHFFMPLFRFIGTMYVSICMRIYYIKFGHWLYRNFLWKALSRATKYFCHCARSETNQKAAIVACNRSNSNGIVVGIVLDHGRYLSIYILIFASFVTNSGDWPRAYFISKLWKSNNWAEWLKC